MEELLRTLIAIPSVSGNFAGNNQILELLTARFEDLGLRTKQFESNKYRSIYAATNPEYKTPKVCLVAHTDVVAAPADAFALKVQDGKYYGRGVLDMKFALAAFVGALTDLRASLPVLDIGVLITSDEEISGQYGAKIFVEDGYRPDVCLIPDGGYNWEIETLAKGIEWYEIRTVGRNAHASRPWLGDSASARLVTILHQISELFPEPSLMADTLNIGTLYAGGSTNQVSDHSMATLDVRFASNESHDILDAKIRDICARNNAFIKSLFDNHTTVMTDINHPLISPIVPIIEDITGSPAGTRISCASGDARYFASVGSQSIVVCPRGGNHHASDEWMFSEDLVRYKDVIVAYLQSVANRQVQLQERVEARV